MNKKWIATLITVLGLCAVFFLLCQKPLKVVAIVEYAKTPEAVASSVFTAQANSRSLFVESFQSIDYVRFAADSGTFSLEITANEEIGSYLISPTTKEVRMGTVKGNKLTIPIPSVPFHCVVHINNLRQIVIFADPLEANPPRMTDANVVNVMDYVTDNTGSTDQSSNIMNAIEVASETPGKDTLIFPNGTYLTSPLTIANRKNLKIYLQDGVLIKRTVADPAVEIATLYFEACDGCKLFGRGVIDSQGLEQFNLNRSKGGGNRSIFIYKTSNMKVEDIINRNGNSWQFSIHSSSHSTFFNVKDVSTYSGVSGNTDGFSIHNSHDITADHIFAMANDDTLVINSDHPDLPVYNITVTNFTGYCTTVNSIAMGYSPLPGSYVSNVIVQDSDFRLGQEGFWDQYSSPVKIEKGPSYYENIRFRNVNFSNNRTITPYITTTNFTFGPGDTIRVKGDLEFSDCTFENETTADIGGDPDDKIDRLIVNNLKLGGIVRTSPSDANMTVTNVKSIDFSE